MHVGRSRVGQWGSQSALAASVASRYALGANGVGAARPGARGSRVPASRYALGAEGGGAARPGACMCSPRNCLHPHRTLHATPHPSPYALQHPTPYTPHPPTPPTPCRCTSSLHPTP